MIGQRDSGGIKHLQKKIPYQPVGFFDFIEQKNTLPVFGKDFPQPAGAASLITHEQLHVVQVKEFRHVEAKHGIIPEKVAGKFQRQFCLPYSGRPEE